MPIAQTSASAGQGNKAESLAGSLLSVPVLEVTVVLALCSYFYLRWKSRKQVSQFWQASLLSACRLMGLSSRTSA